MFLAVPAAGADEGYGHLIGFLVAMLLAYLAVWGHQVWMERNGPSPTPPWARGSDVTPGETDDLTPDDTDDDTEPDRGEGRRIVTLADGSRVVRYFSYAPDDDDPDEETEEDETREEMADRLLPLIKAKRCSYSDAVREIMNSFDVSESTAKRALGDAQKRARR